MSSPGVKLSEVVANIPVGEITARLDVGITKTLSYLLPQENLVSALRQAFVSVIEERPESFFLDVSVRKILLSAISTSKVEELARRSQLSISELFESDLKEDSMQLNRILGFFGLEQTFRPVFTQKSTTTIVRAGFPLFPHQRRASDRVWNIISKGVSRVILHMPTGSGKTRTAMHLVARFLNNYEPGIVVWLANSAELLDQAAEAFEESWKHLGNRDITLKRAWGMHSLELDGFEDGILIGGFQKMHSFCKNSPIEYFRLGMKTKLVVVDEAHQAIAPSYKQTINGLVEAGSYTALVGLSATPGRTWSDIQEDARLSEFFEDRKVTLEIPGYDNPVQYLIDNGYLAKPSFRSLRCESSADYICRWKSTGVDYDPNMLDSLSDDYERNLMIVGEIRRLIEEGHRRIILFSSSVKHAEIISTILKILEINSMVVTGASSEGQRRKAIKQYKQESPDPVVMCNFGVLTTGFDAPRTSAVVIARPTKSLVLYSQMVGRATRGERAGGNKECVVSTVVDTALPGFGDIAEAFMNWEDVWSNNNGKCRK